MSKVEVNQISSQCGSTLTIGQSGDTVTLAAGATQTGFGRTGTVDWDTTAKTTSFTAVSGNGYFVNTTSGAITMTLPASPSAGDIVAFKDYANTFDTNNLIIERNGSLIGGTAANATISVEGQAVTMVYVDGTKGWLATDAATESDLPKPLFVTATGGTVTCCGDYKIHTFTGPGTFTVSCAGNPNGSTTVDYLVVAGGGGGTDQRGAGGGAGGFRLSNSTCMPAPLTSPLANPTGITASVTSYPITVGAGGAGFGSFPSPLAFGNPGSNSVFSTITSTGGGGAANDAPPGVGGSGGSGGGGVAVGGGPSEPGGAGNTPPVSPPQGNPGGSGAQAPFHGAGGGGGASAAGGNGATNGTGGPGGTGSYVLGTGFAGSNGTPGPVCGAKYFAGGGGGSFYCTGTAGTGGTGGGGTSGTGPGPAPNAAGQSGTTNTGGGGGGGWHPSLGQAGGSGGSGIVIIRYKYQ
jgi:hypothetical protein